MAVALTPGTRLDRETEKYAGVLRRGRTVVAECGHLHTNRDISTRSNGQSARDCIVDVLDGARRPTVAAELLARARQGWQNLTRGPWQVTDAQIARARQDCARDAAALEALLARVRDLDITPPPGPAAEQLTIDAPAELGETPAWMC